MYSGKFLALPKTDTGRVRLYLLDEKRKKLVAFAEIYRFGTL